MVPLTNKNMWFTDFHKGGRIWHNVDLTARKGPSLVVGNKNYSITVGIYL